MHFKNLDIGSSLGSDNKFVDDTFKPDNDKIVKEQRKENIQWGRPSIFMTKNHSVFEGKI